VEENEAAHPVHISFFGVVGVVFDAQGFAELVEKFLATKFFDHSEKMVYIKTVNGPSRFLLTR